MGFLVKESKVATQIQSNDVNKENSSMGKLRAGLILNGQKNTM